MTWQICAVRKSNAANVSPVHTAVPSARAPCAAVSTAELPCHETPPADSQHRHAWRLGRPEEGARRKMAYKVDDKAYAYEAEKLAAIRTAKPWMEKCVSQSLCAVWRGSAAPRQTHPDACTARCTSRRPACPLWLA